MRRIRSLEAPPGPGPERRRSRLLLERLLRAEARARRERRLFALLIAGAMAALAAADAGWGERSLAAGYVLPIVLGAYAFGIRMGVLLSLLAVVLRCVVPGRSQGFWWVYVGGALMLAEYVVLAVGVGLLGRAARRLERQGRLLRLLNAHGRALASVLDPVVVRRMAVEAAIELAGADGGLAAEAEGAMWKADAVWRDGHWEERPLAWTAETPDLPEPLLRALDANRQLALRVPVARPLALVVFRAVPEPFAEATREVLELFALRVGAALGAADRYRAAVQGTHEKAQMLARVAHEMATPLHVILGLTDVLEAHADAFGKEALARLQRQAQTLRALTANLLEFSRAEASLPTARRESIHVPALYERAREAAVAVIGAKAVRVDVVVEAGAEWVESDPEMLRQIVTNLATNAAKYTPEGRVELRATPANGDVFLAVSDTGVGIPESEHELIFEPFYRSPSAGPESGVGLGLALVRDLGHLLDTRVVVRSREGAGATFSLAVPCGRRTGSEPREARHGGAGIGHA